MFEPSRLHGALLGAMAAGLLPLPGHAQGNQFNGLSDPTRPLGWSASPGLSAQAQPQPAGDLRLQGTFSVDGRKSAMLSGHRVAVGDQVAGATVLAIEHRRVLLRVDDEVVVLAATMPDVKSPAGTVGGRP